METLKKQIGQKAESLAADYLTQKGLKILERNWKTKFGEIDILAEDSKTLVCVEVKAKTSDDFGQPSEMVDFKKQRKLLKIAHFLESKTNRPIRVDVVAVDWSYNPNQPKIEYFVSAVEE